MMLGTLHPKRDIYYLHIVNVTVFKNNLFDVRSDKLPKAAECILIALSDIIDGIFLTSCSILHHDNALWSYGITGC